MDVRLLYHTPDPERAVAVAARLCYAPIGAGDLMDEMSDEVARKVLCKIMGSGHYSALEHASYTYAVDGVSRAMTHQLVRHRLASYNQQSQRYVRFDESLDVIVPPAVMQHDGTSSVFDRAVRSSLEAYRELLEAGVEPEDARYVLPSAAETKIVVSMNLRELLHFFALRCCRRAQWEIRTLATRMLELAQPTAPYVLQDAGAPCRRGSCPEASMTCGQPFEKVTRREWS